MIQNKLQKIFLHELLQGVSSLEFQLLIKRKNRNPKKKRLRNLRRRKKNHLQKMPSRPKAAKLRSVSQHDITQLTVLTCQRIPTHLHCLYPCMFTCWRDHLVVPHKHRLLVLLCFRLMHHHLNGLVTQLHLLQSSHVGIRQCLTLWCSQYLDHNSQLHLTGRFCSTLHHLDEPCTLFICKATVHWP